MKYISTRSGIGASGVETVFRGLAPDGGLYVPLTVEKLSVEKLRGLRTLRDCEAAVMGIFFDDFPEEVRSAAVDRLCNRFPKDDPIPLVERDGLFILELFHGRTGAFKDVALSMLPVFMRHAANGRRILILTATSGDTGSAAMQGFAGVEGTEIIVFYPATGTSGIQRLQMTTPAAVNVHAVGIRGNFDDAQAAVKRVFVDKGMRNEAERRGIALSSANSINTGRLVPQIAYYVLMGAKLFSHPSALDRHHCFDVVVPSGNFGNILAAYYARMLGVPIRNLVVASNVNDVLARFVATGVYEPGERFAITNSPSMDIRRSSNVERLLWMLNDGDCAEVARLMGDLEGRGRYALNEKAKSRLLATFEGGVATPEETEAEMRRMRGACGYLLDPHTAVATCVARKLGYPQSGVPCVVVATATPYKFPETCMRAFGADVLTDPPLSFRNLGTLPVVQTRICDVDAIGREVTRLLPGRRGGLRRLDETA